MKIYLLILFSMGLSIGYTQTLEELEAMKAEKEAAKGEVMEQVKSIDAEIADIDKLIKEFPTWTTGFTGLIGLDFKGASNWFAADVPNNSQTGLGISLNAFANRDAPKYFWWNSAVANYSTAKVKNEIPNEPEQELTSEASFFGLNSIGGYALTEKLFVSAEGRYETTVLEFNDPGKLLFSAGVTWKPIANLVVIAHPLGYQINFPTGDYTSSTGAKIGAIYNGTLVPGVEWSSNLNAFLSYSGDDDKNFTAGDLSNWTWLNTFTVANIFKGVGLGFNIGLRKDKQLAVAKGATDSPLQSFYNIGLSYSL